MMLRRFMVCLAILALLPFSAFAEDAQGTRLADAARGRDVDTVRAMLKRGMTKADVNTQGSDGTPALHWIVRLDDLETTGLLIRAGADVTLANRYGVTPLFLACSNGNAGMIRTLLDAGADPNSLDATGEPVLWTAIRSGNTDSVRLLLDRGANKDYMDNVQQTTLMFAVRENHPSIVRLLVERGANVNARTRTGNTPGWVLPNSVAGFGHGVGIVRGGLPDRGSRYLTPGGLSALLYAARDGRLESARILVEAGADVNQTDPNGIHSLLMAIVNNHPETAHFLIERGAAINHVDWYGRTPLWAAVETRNMDVHNATYKNEVDREPLLRLIEVLLERGANANVRILETPPIRRFMLPTTGSLAWVDLTGQTPFLTAALSGDVAAMRLLLKYGADPKIPTFGGTTALMAAAGINWVVSQTYDEGPERLLEAVKLCFDLGLSVHDVNSMGLTAVHGAANRGSDEIIKFLVEKGARLDVKDKEGRTPMTWAEGVFLATHAPVPKPSSIALIQSLLEKQ
jgi:ankyrin repeat protein